MKNIVTQAMPVRLASIDASRGAPCASKRYRLARVLPNGLEENARLTLIRLVRRSHNMKVNEQVDVKGYVIIYSVELGQQGKHSTSQSKCMSDSPLLYTEIFCISTADGNIAYPDLGRRLAYHIPACYKVVDLLG